MREDTRLRSLLRSAVPPIVTTAPSRDLWPLVVKRIHGRAKWSWLDAGLAAGAAIALLMRLDWLVLLAYCF